MVPRRSETDPEFQPACLSGLPFRLAREIMWPCDGPIKCQGTTFETRLPGREFRLLHGAQRRCLDGPQLLCQRAGKLVISVENGL
jgi:hypothetical protein